MSELVDLDGVMLTMEAFDAWQAVAVKIAQLLDILRATGRMIDPSVIPDEQARIEDDGTLTIYVIIPDLMEVSLIVPSGQWDRRH